MSDIIRVVIQHMDNNPPHEVSGIKHVIEDSLSGDIFVAKAENLCIYYRSSRYHKRLSHDDLAYHACLVAQSLGYHAGQLESQLKTRKPPKKANKRDVDGRAQKGLF